MSEISANALAAIDAINLKYVEALDSKEMNKWLDAFSGDDIASYICISRENVNRGLPLALMMDDCKARLFDRVTYITKIWAGTFEDYQTRHFVQRVRAERISDLDFKVWSNFSVLYTPDNGGSSGVLATGVYEDEIRLTSDQSGARILSRRAVLDTTVLPRYLVYPL
ncbi:aromatic-ring-hydroxylating dioxygenase subunit beta [Paraburkholderia sp. GAS32]|uniref:aromatic-ring-hydroxylating dioxygenase subunit beta n=1 Tax=Paraburkholderia sp. GAS32 TaxID=3035129 RepID=UPI003D1FBD3C